MTPLSKPRPLMEQAYERASCGDVAVVVAPTSYGKTAASPWMYRRAYEDGVAGGLIHVAPLRSLLRRAYRDFFEPHGGRLQMHGAAAEEKSPYFLSSLVASTLDSFLWNLYRVPVAEALKIERGVSMGHYYPVLAAIFTSLVVFDEAHMYLWEDPGGPSHGVGVEAVEAAVSTLAEAGVPFIVETATVRPSVAARLARVAGRQRRRVDGSVWVGALRAPGGSGECPYLDALRGAVGGVVGVEDPEWEAEKLVPWKTGITAGGWEAALGEIAEEASRGPVLVVANTVGEAVGVYRELLADSRVPEAILVHGRLGEAERAEAEKRLERIEERGGVVVATQAAEAGLDVNSLAVYTAPAPLESLVQRAGRACRRGGVLEECRANGGKVMVVRGASTGPYDEGELSEALRLVGGIVSGRGGGALDWRAPCNGNGRVGYGSLLARLGGGRERRSSLGRLLREYLAGDVQPWVLVDEILDGACGLVRGTAMIEVVAGGDVVVVSLDWALRHAGEVLETVDEAPVLVVDAGKGNVAEGPARELWREWRRTRGRWPGRGCGRLLKALSRDAARIAGGGAGVALATARLKARPDAYVEGVGLLLPGERGDGGGV